MAIVELSISPLGTAGPGISNYVAGCVRLAKQSGIKYQLTPMGTILEGSLDEIFPLIRMMQESVFDAGAVRVSSHIKIDDRRDPDCHSMEDKIVAVTDKL